ncbi:MAG: hypothetical protein IPM82_20150 [Saprospiraceae bacterium]|nr:hypothetical protein [Saprospiraceae bacterium]
MDVNVDLPDRQAQPLHEFRDAKVQVVCRWRNKENNTAFSPNSSLEGQSLATAAPWQIMDRNRGIELFEGINFNIENTAQEGIKNDE